MEKNFNYEQFQTRHIGPRKDDVTEMLQTIGVSSFDELIEKTIPSNIRLKEGLKLDDPVSEFEFICELKEIASKNKIFDSYIGMGYYPTILPAVIQRNILENPGWYTQYTPYQAEISQGRLEALLNFQTMVSDLTGLPLANASLLDEATAAAEAMIMLFNARKRDKKNSDLFLVSDKCFPQTIDVLKVRAKALNIKLKITDIKEDDLTDEVFGLLVQYPDQFGNVEDFSSLASSAKEKGIFTVVAADLLSLALLKAPGKMGADVAVGTSQRFGVPMMYGGPHAAYFATTENFKRQIPGRIIGVSIDADGNPALRMALQTREQHIKREKATSNICTAQVLLAIMAGMYAVYHGKDGIKNIAERINGLAKALDKSLSQLGVEQLNKHYFDTLRVKLDSAKVAEIRKLSLENRINLRYINEEEIGISFGETHTIKNVNKLVDIFAQVLGKEASVSLEDFSSIPEELKRDTDYLTHPVFNSYHSETDMMRYIKKLERRDLSLTHSMISLGSCTMKLNAASELLGITWPEFANIHPFVPEDQALGYRELFQRLENQLKAITGFAAVTLQPNSGAAGEYTGLQVIRAYQEKNGEGHRNVVLIPASAHGTNPASAVMAGGKVVVVKCDDKGNIDVDDLKAKAEEHKDNLSALMVTYPSTHGVFEESIIEICDIIHKNGAQVYMDGANMNAQVGLTSPANIGADVCHLNLHKTFAIPHGGGGPGVGPIAVAEHLSDFLPGHAVVDINRPNSINAVAAAPWGSAGVMSISYAYIRMMGAEGLTEATKYAILNANYLKAKLKDDYQVLYTNKNGFVAHELIFDTHVFKASSGVDVEDIAKRLMDYGFHAPTVSFPVHGTLMVEPTESESKMELDHFCEVMHLIREEIREIEEGKADKENNLLKNAPHTANMLTADEWNYPYSKERAVFPDTFSKENKFWPFVRRINNAHGDRNLVCNCPPIEDYQ